MKFDTLDQWLRWQETLHPRAIDLGLERVWHVLQSLSLRHPPYRIISVGGTNGKGSSVALLEAMLRAEGYRVAAYTSPHILRYNERIRVDAREVSDGELCEAFDRIEEARGDVRLTYFEYGTLAALEHFSRRSVDVAVLEVGMGGRLDAVNAVDADASLICSIGLDHQEWLGPDRESIGREKAGLFRRDRPGICGDRSPPDSVFEQARAEGTRLQVLGRDFHWNEHGGLWRWHGREGGVEALPAPALPGRIQYDNAASVIAVLKSLRECLPVKDGSLRMGLKQVRLRARFERVPGVVERIFDVAHNPDAARVLAENLKSAPAAGRTLAVLGMLADKSVEGVVRELHGYFDGWFVATLTGARGQSAETLATRIRGVDSGATIIECDSVPAAHAQALATARPGDRLVIFGSFHTVAEVQALG